MTPEMLRPMIDRAARLLRSIIALKLTVDPARLTVRIDVSDPDKDGNVAVRFETLLDGKDLSPDQEKQVQAILRSFAPGGVAPKAP